MSDEIEDFMDRNGADLADKLDAIQESKRASKGCCRKCGRDTVGLVLCQKCLNKLSADMVAAGVFGPTDEDLEKQDYE